MFSAEGPQKVFVDIFADALPGLYGGSRKVLSNARVLYFQDIIITPAASSRRNAFATSNSAGYNGHFKGVPCIGSPYNKRQLKFTINE